MGKLSKYLGIASLLLILIPIVTSNHTWLFYLSMVFGLIAVMLGIMVRGNADQGRPALIGIAVGSLSLAANFLITLYY